MSGYFLSNFSLTVTLNFLIKLFWVFVIEIAVQNTLGAEEYGVYFESFNFTYIFYILLDIGLSNYTNRTVAGNPETLHSIFPAIFSIKLLLSVLFLGVIFLAAQVLNYDERHVQVVMFIGFNQILLSMLLYFRSIIGGLHLFRIDALLSVLDRLVMGVVCAFLLWFPLKYFQFNLNAYLVVMTLGYGISMLIGWALIYRQGVRMNFVLDRKLMGQILRKAVPFALLFFLMGLYTRIDSVMLGRMLEDGEYQVGIYASAFRLLDAAIIFAVLLSGLLLPMFSRMISKNEPVLKLVRESFYIVWIPAVLLPLIVYYYSDFLYPLMYRENHVYGSIIFGLLMINFMPMALGYIFGTLLTAKSELKLLNIISLAGLILNVSLNALLIPHWQAKGAVIATIATQSLVTLCTFAFSLHYFRLPVYEFLHLRVIGYGLLNLLAFYLFHRYMANPALGLLLAIAVGLVTVPIFRLIRVQDLKQMVKTARPTS
ncbi:MAG: oligosaccharide flippase family protein [Bacteroidetes bacterium]|nr:oligosaccharide flippase family protein [Bacteroidota bacterium]